MDNEADDDGSIFFALSSLCPHIEFLLCAKNSVGYLIFNSHHNCVSRRIISFFI